MSAALVPSVGSEGESAPCLSPGFWWLPAILGIPWLVDMSLKSMLCPHGAPSAFLLPFSFLMTIFVSGFRAHPDNPGRSHIEILKLLASAKTLFPNKITFTGLGRPIFWEAELLHRLQAGR